MYKRQNKRQRSKNLNLDVLFSEYSWSGGFIWVGKDDSRPAAYLEEYDPTPTPEALGLKGQRSGFTIELDRVDQLKEGDWIQALWYNKSGDPESPIIDALYCETDLKIGSHH